MEYEISSEGVVSPFIQCDTVCRVTPRYFPRAFAVICLDFMEARSRSPNVQLNDLDFMRFMSFSLSLVAILSVAGSFLLWYVLKRQWRKGWLFPPMCIEVRTDGCLPNAEDF